MNHISWCTFSSAKHSVIVLKSLRILIACYTHFFALHRHLIWNTVRKTIIFLCLWLNSDLNRNFLMKYFNSFLFTQRTCNFKAWCKWICKILWSRKYILLPILILLSFIQQWNHFSKVFLSAISTVAEGQPKIISSSKTFHLN